ncbi:MAG: serine protease [Candidatus Omnitrophota bacterium]
MTITKTLASSQSATFCIALPDPQQHMMPTPTGTGFFVSPDGWFVTAAHVITENNESDGPVRQDIDQAWLQKETRQPGGMPGVTYQFVSFGHVIPRLDFALLKVDFQQNSNKAWLSGRNSFPFIGISSRQLMEGESVYSFGYPLSSAFAKDHGQIMVGYTSLCPRVTSAIVSSTINETHVAMTSGDPKVYVLDKALNYGNSGGPIVSSETGRVHAFCSRFQPVFIPQKHILDAKQNPIQIMIPSLYGVVSSFGNPEIISLLHKLQVPIYDE